MSVRDHGSTPRRRQHAPRAAGVLLLAFSLAPSCGNDPADTGQGLRGLPALDGRDPRTVAEQPVASRVLAGQSADPEHFAADPWTGWRPRRDVRFAARAVSLATGEPSQVDGERDGWGFLACPDRVPTDADSIGSPRVLIVGDEQLGAGVPASEHAATRIRARLRVARRFARAEVANAACDGHGLVQALLRAHAIAPSFRPDVVLVGVSLGDDLFQLVDSTLPSLDANGAWQPGRAGPPASSVYAQQVGQSLGLPAADRGLALHGLAQAAVLQDAEKFDESVAAMGRVVDAFRRLADARGFALVFVTIPSFDLVFPDKIERLPRAASLIAGNAQMRARERLLELLGSRGVKTVPLLDDFVWAGPIDLYTSDFRLHTSGHRRLAEVVLPVLRDLLDTRAR